VHVYLGGRQAYPGGVVHGFEHIVDQRPGGIRDLGHRLSLCAQAGVGEFENVEYSHGDKCSKNSLEGGMAA
jgi:hypothetical protein